jgi:hypothetical protein
MVLTFKTETCLNEITVKAIFFLLAMSANRDFQIITKMNLRQRKNKL